MSGFDDLVVVGQPALLGGGLIHEGFTEGRTWLFTLEIRDFDGTLVDWTDVTAFGNLMADRTEDAAVAIALDVTLPSAGIVQVRKEASDTADLENQNSCLALWLVKSGTPDLEVQICYPANSPCPIRSSD